METSLGKRTREEEVNTCEADSAIQKAYSRIRFKTMRRSMLLRIMFEIMCQEVENDCKDRAKSIMLSFEAKERGAAIKN